MNILLRFSKKIMLGKAYMIYINFTVEYTLIISRVMQYSWFHWIFKMNFSLGIFVAQHPNLMIQTNAQWFKRPPIPKCSDLYVYTRDWPASENRKSSWVELSWAEERRPSCEENPLQKWRPTWGRVKSRWHEVGRLARVTEPWACWRRCFRTMTMKILKIEPIKTFSKTMNNDLKPIKNSRWGGRPTGRARRKSKKKCKDGSKSRRVWSGIENMKEEDGSMYWWTEEDENQGDGEWRWKKEKTKTKQEEIYKDIRWQENRDKARVSPAKSLYQQRAVRLQL